MEVRSCLQLGRAAVPAVPAAAVGNWLCAELAGLCMHQQPVLADWLLLGSRCSSVANPIGRLARLAAAAAQPPGHRLFTSAPTAPLSRACSAHDVECLAAQPARGSQVCDPLLHTLHASQADVAAAGGLAAAASIQGAHAAGGLAVLAQLNVFRPCHAAAVPCYALQWGHRRERCCVAALCSKPRP